MLAAHWLRHATNTSEDLKRLKPQLDRFGERLDDLCEEFSGLLDYLAAVGPTREPPKKPPVRQAKVVALRPIAPLRREAVEQARQEYWELQMRYDREEAERLRGETFDIARYFDPILYGFRPPAKKKA